MILNQTEIKAILPQRDPILLVDQVNELTAGSEIEASVYIDPDWDIFRGHFPGKPILPGIYITECLAQTAAVLLLSCSEHQGKLPLLFQVGQMRFLRTVTPGSEMQMIASVSADVGNGMYDCKVRAFVSEKKVASGMITLALK